MYQQQDAYGYGYGGTSGEYADEDGYYDEYDYGQTQYDSSQLPIYVEHQPAAVQASGQEVNLQFFYENLAPYGNWVRHARYGWVWYPNDVSLIGGRTPRAAGSDRGVRLDVGLAGALGLGPVSLWALGPGPALRLDLGARPRLGAGVGRLADRR